MTDKLRKSLNAFNKTLSKTQLKLTGYLGIHIGGQALVSVPGRNSYVYVRLRDNQNELIQAFNNQVSQVYDLPVILIRDGNRYIVESVDTKRYENNWPDSSSYLPAHGLSHSFDPEDGGGGDMVWVYTRQFIPMLVYPSGSLGSPSVQIYPYILRDINGIWRYVGNTGTVNLAPTYNPASPNGVMVLVYIDATTGNPGILVGSGSYFSENLTGTKDVYSHIPSIGTNPSIIPLGAVRLVHGTSAIGWDSIYDVRQFVQPIPTGTISGGGGGGGGGVDQIGVFVQDEGVPLGTGTILNFVGPNVDVSLSGTVARIFITGSTGAGGIPSGTIQLYNTGTFVGSADKIDANQPIYFGITGSRGYLSLNGFLLAIEDFSNLLTATGSPNHFVLTGTIALGTDRLYYNGLRQYETQHYNVDSDGRGFTTVFTGSVGDHLIMEYGNMGAQPLLPVGLQNLPVFQDGVFVRNATKLNLTNGLLASSDLITPGLVNISGTISSGPGGSSDFVKIASFVLTSPTGSFIFSGFDLSQYSHLMIKASLRGATGTDTDGEIVVELNGDTNGLNYNRLRMDSSPSGTLGSVSSQVANRSEFSQSDNAMGYVPGKGALAFMFSEDEFTILNFGSLSMYKSIHRRGSFFASVSGTNSSSAQSQTMVDNTVWWRNTGSVTSIRIKCGGADTKHFEKGSAMYLYGMK